MFAEESTIIISIKVPPYSPNVCLVQHSCTFRLTVVHAKISLHGLKEMKGDTGCFHHFHIL